MTDITLRYPPISYNSPFAGDQPTKTRHVTVSGTGPLAAFTVLGRIAATDVYTVAVAAAADGSAVPVAVLSCDVDVTAGPVVVAVHTEGEFADRLLTYGAGHTPATVETAWRDANLQLYIRTLPILG